MFLSFITTSLLTSLLPSFLIINPIESINIPIALNYINRFREMHQVEPLIHDREITKVSTEWAQTIIDTGKFEHSTTDYGENIAYTYSPNHYNSFVRATNMFYNEVKDYNYSNPVFGYNTGHFTQLVWSSSKKIGIGMVSNDTITVLVLNFFPHGNVGGQFVNNVLPRV